MVQMSKSYVTVLWSTGLATLNLFFITLISLVAIDVLQCRGNRLTQSFKSMPERPGSSCEVNNLFTACY